MIVVLQDTIQTFDDFMKIFSNGPHPLFYDELFLSFSSSL